MKYSLINKMDTVNGEGIACSLYVQGCTHHCHNCFNPETWSFSGGRLWTARVEKQFFDIAKSPDIDCVSILGGEPFDQDFFEDFLARLKEEVGKPIYVWSGYTYEELLNRGRTLEDVDYLIDGEYVHELKDPSLWLRGSSNQRVIDVQESLKKGTVVIHQEKYL